MNRGLTCELVGGRLSNVGSELVFLLTIFSFFITIIIDSKSIKITQVKFLFVHDLGQAPVQHQVVMAQDIRMVDPHLIGGEYVFGAC